MATESAVYDTLFGGPEIDIGGTSGELSVGSRATEHGSVVANIQAWAYPTVYVGYAIPAEAPAVYCTSSGFFCNQGHFYVIDCETEGGARIKANSEHYVTYQNTNGASGTLSRDKSCFPSGAGGGGGGGGQTRCDTYIVEMSTDGGATWFEIGRFTICSG